MSALRVNSGTAGAPPSRTLGASGFCCNSRVRGPKPACFPRIWPPITSQTSRLS